MSTITLRQVSDRVFAIDGCAALSGRQTMKFNIYLNSLENIAIDRSDSICITVNLGDQFAIAKLLEGIIAFLEKQSCEVHTDDAVSTLLNNGAQQITESETVLDALKQIKADSVSAEPGYSTFCSFCDDNLKIRLRDYQYKAAYALSVGKGGFDFSVPGAGKTIITYAAYMHLKSVGSVERIFVIGPGSSYNAWYDEYHTCFGVYPEFENLAEGSTKDCKIYLNASAKNHKEISFINMEKVRLLQREISHCVSDSKTLLIIDEAHKIKNPDAAVTAAVLEIAKHACARIILTGTPMPNGYEDLYSLTKTFSPFVDILPYNYNQLKQMSKKEASAAQAAAIRTCLAPYYSRISKKYLLQTKELLPANFHIVPCQMDSDQYELYQRLNEFCGKMHESVDEDILMSFKKAVLIRKMQISANPALLKKSLISSMDELKEEYASASEKVSENIGKLIQADRELINSLSTSSIAQTINKYERGAMPTAKNLRALEIARDLVSQGKKVLIWDIFVKNMDILYELLSSSLKVGVELVNGSVNGADRQAAIKRFREGNSMILLANPATLAESISLHKVCQHAIYVNRNFNAAQYIQSKDRIHRINMPLGTTATYYFLLNDDSVDICINERLTLKENRMLAILDADDITVGGSELEDGSIMSEQDIENSYMR